MGATGVAAGILLPVNIVSSSFFDFHFFRILRSGGKDVLLAEFLATLFKTPSKFFFSLFAIKVRMDSFANPS